MKTFVPAYYPLFHCLMNRCRHSCCVGWEIDIDENTYQKYAALDADGADICSHIEKGESGAHIVLSTGLRCPFLTEEGLCRLIINHGEDVLSEICADHPRFRSFFTGITEIGLGMTCEAAAKIILSEKDPFSLVLLSDNGETEEEPDEYEEEILRLRDRLFMIAQDRSKPIDVRLHEIMKEAGADDFDFHELILYLKTLERLDDRWLDLLTEIQEDDAAYLPINPSLSIPLEQFLSYMIFRHIPEALDTGDENGAILLSAFLTVLFITLINRRAKNGLPTEEDDLTDIARMISSEIEYSDENIFLLTEKLHSL